MKYYAGIGSRETPIEILTLMEQVGEYLAIKGYTLRSGGAGGSDSFFEQGSDKANGLKEIYLPWSGFNGNNSNLVVENIKAFEIAEKYHPYWKNLKRGARLLMARNSHQVLGWDLNAPSDFILCYTSKAKLKGGTAQAIKIGLDYNIPVFNMGKYDDIDECIKELKIFLDEF